jgi:FkbM family methyltransferase
MRRRLNQVFEYLMEMTPIQVTRRLPLGTLAPLDLLLATFDARKETKSILQIGACDGVTNDPIHRHLARGSSQALLVEPNPYAFDRLQQTYAGFQNVKLVQCAIGQQDGEAHLYRLKRPRTAESDSSTDFTLQIASFYREHLERHGKKPNEIEEITVPCRSLSSLVSEVGIAKINLLQIDAEGYDAAVVRMALRLPVRPDSINFEHFHLKAADRKPLFDLLQAHDYLLAHDAWNILAVQKSALDEL